MKPLAWVGFALLTTSKQSVGRPFETLQASGSLSKRPPRLSIHPSGTLGRPSLYWDGHKGLSGPVLFPLHPATLRLMDGQQRSSLLPTCSCIYCRYGPEVLFLRACNSSLNYFGAQAPTCGHRDLLHPGARGLATGPHCCFQTNSPSFLASRGVSGFPCTCLAQLWS